MITTNRSRIAACTATIAMMVLSAFVLSLSPGTAAANPQCEDPTARIEICHFTGSESNSPVVIEVSTCAWEDNFGIKHMGHGDTEAVNGQCGACEFTPPACDGVDNDCDGLVDESDECSGG